MVIKRRWLSIAAATGVCAVLVGALCLRGVLNRSHARLTLTPGAAKMYRYSLETVVSSGNGAPASTIQTTVEGILNVRMLEGARAGQMAVQLSPLDVRVGGRREDALSSAFATAFIVAIDERGQFGEPRFPRDVAAGDRALLDSALRSLQIVLPADDEPAWTTRERDANGYFSAAYQRGLRAGTVTKRRVRYASLRDANLFSIRVLESQTEAEFDGDGIWLNAVAGGEKLAFEGPGRQRLAVVQTRFRLSAEPGSPPPDLALWRIEDLPAARMAGLADDESPASTWDEATAARERQRLTKAGMTLDGLLAGLPKNDLANAEFARQLTLFLTLFPDEATRLSSRISGLGDEGAVALLLNILERTGTPQAQAVLAAMAAGAEHSRSDRLRALIAASGLRNPSDETTARVAAIYESARGDPHLRDLSSTAALTLGTMASRASESARQQVRRRLEGDLETASEPRVQRLLLRALGNGRFDLPMATVESTCARSIPASVRRPRASWGSRATRQRRRYWPICCRATRTRRSNGGGGRLESAPTSGGRQRRGKQGLRGTSRGRQGRARSHRGLSRGAAARLSEQPRCPAGRAAS